jgi:TusA-related sulfurtransferase
MPTINVDSRGTKCPGPITDLIRAYKNANNGNEIVILANDPGVVHKNQKWIYRINPEGTDIEVRIKVTGKR